MLKAWQSLSQGTILVNAVTSTLTAISQFLRVSQAHSMHAPPLGKCYFRVGFLESHSRMKRNRVHRVIQTSQPSFVVVHTAAVQELACPVAGGANFGSNWLENFDKVFPSDISVIVGECAMII